jgi:hypothetical protein
MRRGHVTGHPGPWRRVAFGDAAIARNALAALQDRVPGTTKYLERWAATLHGMGMLQRAIDFARALAGRVRKFRGMKEALLETPLAGTEADRRAPS